MLAFVRKVATDAAWRVLTAGLGLAYDLFLRHDEPEPIEVRHVWRGGRRCLCGHPVAGSRTTTILAKSSCLACWDADVVLLALDVAEGLRRAGRTVEAVEMRAAAERGAFAAEVALAAMGEAIGKVDPSLARRMAARRETAPGGKQ